MRRPGLVKAKGYEVERGVFTEIRGLCLVAGGGRRGGLELRDSREAQAGVRHSFHSFSTTKTDHASSKGPSCLSISSHYLQNRIGRRGNNAKIG